ncbi:hypothetical protein TNCV_3433941 [Trichonephila clavipes]|nr:hypothetical protein TNCV_3433941 [Trichonephila clavipes]
MRALELVDKHLNVAAFQIGCLCSVRDRLHPGVLITSKGLAYRSTLSTVVLWGYALRRNLIIEDSSTFGGWTRGIELLPIIRVVRFLHTLTSFFADAAYHKLEEKVVIKGLKLYPITGKKPFPAKCRFRWRTRDQRSQKYKVIKGVQAKKITVKRYSIERHRITLGLGSKSRTGQSRLSFSSLQWVNKMSNKLVWELNIDDFASDRPPDRDICSCTSGPYGIFRPEKRKRRILCERALSCIKLESWHLYPKNERHIDSRFPRYTSQWSSSLCKDTEVCTPVQYDSCPDHQTSSDIMAYPLTVGENTADLWFLPLQLVENHSLC